ncbi:MAG TPA: hypothetical protein VFV97_13600 [Rhodanobacteraceae bacterium]|nr:hypothetical protein [Rhodanobacteraceae bacterium]
MTTLCNDGNADSKLAVYLLSAPVVEGMHTQPDEALLGRALENIGKSDAPLLFLAAMHASADCSDGLARAKRLTDADPENGVAWLMRASMAAMCEEDADQGETLSLLKRAAGSHRFHDYGFDIMKRSAARFVRVPVPADVVASQNAESADQVRFEVLQQSVMVAVAFMSMDSLDFLNHACSDRTPSARNDVREACEGVKRGLSRFGDSAVLLTFDPERQRAATKDGEAVLRDPRVDVVAKAAMRAMAQSHSENEFYRRTRALIGEPKAPAKTH